MNEYLNSFLLLIYPLLQKVQHYQDLNFPCLTIDRNDGILGINEYLIDTNAFNDRNRITNSSEKKKDGLKKFYHKHYVMSINFSNKCHTFSP